MYNFFVLGYIPGTDIQISFTMWCQAVAAICLSAYLYHLHHQHQFAGDALPSISPEATLPPRTVRLIRRTVVILQANSFVRESVSHLQALAGAQSTWLRGYLSRHSSNASE